MTLVRVPLAFLCVAVFIGRDVANHSIDPEKFGFLRGEFEIVGALGFATILAGLAMRGWAAGVIVKAREVSREGPYALVRHPLYLGSLLIAIGFCIVIGDNLNILVVMIFALLVYWPKLRAEEHEMTEQFGAEYVKYMETVPAFLPVRIPATVRGRWVWRQYLHHREYRAALAVLLALIILDALARMDF